MIKLSGSVVYSLYKRETIANIIPITPNGITTIRTKAFESFVVN